MMQKDEAHQSSTLSCPLLPTNYKLILVFNYFHNWSLSITIWMFVAWCFCPQPTPMPKKCNMLSWKICRNIQVPVLYFPNFQSTRFDIKISKNRQAQEWSQIFRLVRICYFRNKCVVFARNSKFANLTQWNMQYIPCNSALLAQKTLFLTQKGTFFAQRSPKSA